jgi:hypothetical protein
LVLKLPNGCSADGVVTATMGGGAVVLEALFGLPPAPPMLPVFSFSLVAVFSSSWPGIEPAEKTFFLSKFYSTLQISARVAFKILFSIATRIYQLNYVWQKVANNNFFLKSSKIILASTRCTNLLYVIKNSNSSLKLFTVFLGVFTKTAHLNCKTQHDSHSK